MIEKMHIEYPPFIFEEFDLDQPFESQLEKYSFWLEGAKKLTPETYEEKSTLQDYINILELLISAYTNLIDAVHRYKLLPADSKLIKDVVKRHKGIITGHASTVRFRETDLIYLKQVEALRVMLYRAKLTDDDWSGCEELPTKQIATDLKDLNKKRIRPTKINANGTVSRRHDWLRIVSGAVIITLGTLVGVAIGSNDLEISVLHSAATIVSAVIGTLLIKNGIAKRR